MFYDSNKNNNNDIIQDTLDYLIYRFDNTNNYKQIGRSQIDLLRPSQGYDVSRYPWAYDYWKKQQQIHWLPEEIPMGEDLKDWQSNLVENERNLLTQIFRLFTQSDIEVNDNYLKRYIQLFQPLEIQMMLVAFSNIECVHIEAYALLLKTLGMPEIEFQAFKQYAQMQAKIDYLHKFNMNTDGDVARTLAGFGAFTEGMSLFASFVMLLNFPRYNKMRGMGQIITYSVRDESLHTEGIIKLFHEWNKQTFAVNESVKDDIIDIAKTTISLEDKFIELAFNLGDVEGLSAVNVKDYIRYIADWRLSQLKLQPIFGYFKLENGDYKQIKPHPLPWLLSILNGVEHANFFEVRATEYSKAATKGDWHGENGAWTIFDKLLKSY